jgi:enoyl-CoA hydratase
MSEPTADVPAVLTEARESVLVITLNRPERRNAVNEALAHGLASAVSRLDDDADLTVGVLQGAGGTFSTGLDLKAFLAGERPVLDGRGFAGIVGQPPRKPLIAAVEGYALAGGLEIVLACDLVVAARDAAFGLPEVTRGLAAAGGGLIRLGRRIPYSAAMEIALTGAPIDGERAHHLGLVEQLSAPGEALADALALAARIAANAPLALAASKELIRRAADLPEDEAWKLQDRLALPLVDSEDAREGARAFAERRTPVWRGR